MADGEIGAHEATYQSFLALFRFGAVVASVVAAIVVILIAH